MGPDLWVSNNSGTETVAAEAHNIRYISGGGVEGERAHTCVWMIVTMVSEGKWGHKSGEQRNFTFLLWSIPIYSGIETKYFCSWKSIRGGSWMARTQESFMWTSSLLSISSFTLDSGRFEHFFLKMSAGRKGFMLAGLSVDPDGPAAPPPNRLRDLAKRRMMRADYEIVVIIVGANHLRAYSRGC